MTGIDPDRYLAQAKIPVLNARGGRGFERGVRVVRCELCGETRGRGWLTVRGTYGCFNVGCVAEPRLPGGVVEWVRRREFLPTRRDAWKHLQTVAPGDVPDSAVPAHEPSSTGWVRWPAGSVALPALPPVARAAVRGVLSQRWGLSLDEAARWGVEYAMAGPWRERLLIPVVMGGIRVGWQGRHIGSAVPKYRTSRWGSLDDPSAECGTPAGDWLFNLDSIVPGDDVLLVEGPMDVLAWREREPVAVALLGLALTHEKVLRLVAAKPGRVLVASDAELMAQRRANHHVFVLRNWGLQAEPMTWAGGKDAGSGALPVPGGVGNIWRLVARGGIVSLDREGLDGDDSSEEATAVVRGERAPAVLPERAHEGQ